MHTCTLPIKRLWSINNRLCHRHWKRPSHTHPQRETMEFLCGCAKDWNFSFQSIQHSSAITPPPFRARTNVTMVYMPETKRNAPECEKYQSLFCNPNFSHNNWFWLICSIGIKLHWPKILIFQWLPINRIHAKVYPFNIYFWGWESVLYEPTWLTRYHA